LPFSGRGCGADFSAAHIHFGAAIAGAAPNPVVLRSSRRSMAFVSCTPRVGLSSSAGKHPSASNESVNRNAGGAEMRKQAPRSCIPSHRNMAHRTKLLFKSENRTGYLNLDTYQAYSYDSTKHRLTQIQRESDAAQKAQYFYDDTDGRLTKMAYGNNARAEYGYDASGALTKISHFGRVSDQDTLIASVAYAYDLAGNVTRALLDDSLTYYGDAEVTYQYDDLHRLTREYCDPDMYSDRIP
jgi:hypothetical protein